MRIGMIILWIFICEEVFAGLGSKRELDGKREIWVDEGSSLAAAVMAASVGDVLRLHAGIFSADGISASKTLFLSGSGENTILVFSDSGWNQTGGSVHFYDMTLRSYGSSSALITSGNAELYFNDCILDLNQQIFTDSIFAFDSILGDSIIFSGYVELVRCRQDDDWWCFTTGAEAYMTQCSGFNYTRDNLKQEGTAKITIFDSQFYSHGNYNTYAGSGSEAVFTAIGSSFANRGATKYAWDGQDTLKVKLSGCNFNNLIIPNNGLAFRLRGADTLWVGGCQSSGVVTLDTMSVSSNRELYVIMTADNNFANEVYFGGAAENGFYLSSRMQGTSKDHYMFRELLTLPKSLGGCIYDDGSTDVFIHLMDSTGTHSGFLSAEGRLLLEGGNQWFAVGDTINSKPRTKISQIALGSFTWAQSDSREAIYLKGAHPSNTKAFWDYNEDGGALSNSDAIGSVYIKTDSLIFTRGATGLETVVNWIAFTIKP